MTVKELGSAGVLIWKTKVVSKPWMECEIDPDSWQVLHTDDPEKAKEIAMDHLQEFPTYYTALKEMEKKLEE